MSVSPLDVLEGFFGGTPSLDAVGAMSLDQIDELGDLVEQSADALAREPAPAIGDVGQLVYPGGWLARGWGDDLFRVELNCALLYEPRILVHDPLAEYYFGAFHTLPRMRAVKGAQGASTYGGPDLWANHGRRVHRGDDLDLVRADLTRIVRFLLEVEPLLRSGVIVMRSQWPTIRRRQRQIMASAKFDMSSPAMLDAARSATPAGGLLPRWDNLRGGQVTPPGGFLDPNDPAQCQPEFFYLAKTLAVADAAGATYAPSTPDEQRLLIAKSVTAASSARRSAPSPPVLRQVLSYLVPDLTLDPSTAVKVRVSETSFEAWRRALRDVQRDAGRLSDPDDLSQLVEDRLRPQVEAVTKSVNASASLRRTAGPSITAAVIAAATGPLTGSTLTGSIAGASAAAVGNWIAAAYQGRRPDGTAAVVAALLRNRVS